MWWGLPSDGAPGEAYRFIENLLGEEVRERPGGEWFGWLYNNHTILVKEAKRDGGALGVGAGLSFPFRRFARPPKLVSSPGERESPASEPLCEDQHVHSHMSRASMLLFF